MVVKFIKGRKYMNNEIWLVECRTFKNITLKSKNETVTCPVEKDRIKEFCCPKPGTMLLATSIMGRPQHYTEDENKELHIKASRAFNKRAYKTVTFNLEPDVAKELKDYSEKTGTAQRQIVMMAVKKYLEELQK